MGSVSGKEKPTIHLPAIDGQIIEHSLIRLEAEYPMITVHQGDLEWGPSDIELCDDCWGSSMGLTQWLYDQLSDVDGEIPVETCIELKILERDGDSKGVTIKSCCGGSAAIQIDIIQIPSTECSECAPLYATQKRVREKAEATAELLDLHVKEMSVNNKRQRS